MAGALALLSFTLYPSPPISASEAVLQDAIPSSATALLDQAFRNRYDCTLSGIVHIAVQRGDAKALERQIHVASKYIDSKLHTYALFRKPSYVRGMSFLGIESDEPGRSEERFVYLPSTRKIRRVSASQRADSFLGTDLSYHDFERRRVEHYEIGPLGKQTIDGESAYSVKATPRFHSAYAEVEFAIAEADGAILRTRYFKRNDEFPYKEMFMPRTHIAAHGDCRVPQLVEVSNHQQKTHTKLVVQRIQLDAQLKDSLFTMTSLQTARPIPGLSDAPRGSSN